MAELEHSRRSMPRATYTPIRVERPRDGEPSASGGGQAGRALDKWSYLASLAITEEEMKLVVGRLSREGSPLPPEERAHLGVIAEGISQHPEVPEASLPLVMMQRLGEVPARVLSLVGAELLVIREAALSQTFDRHAAIATRYNDAMRRATTGTPDARPALPRGYERDPDFSPPGMTGATAYRFESAPIVLNELPPGPRGARRSTAAAAAASGDDAVTGFGSEAGTMVVFAQPPSPTPAAPAPAASVSAMMRWAIDNDVERAAASAILAVAERQGVADGATSIAQVRSAALVGVSALRDANHAFAERMRVEPVGLLHLERLSFIPAGIERGELMYSVPLSPGEQVNIAHKEWSNTSEEFSRIVTDFVEAFSEEGVSEKSELSQSTTSQQQHSSGFDLGVTASGSWGPVSISTSANFNVQDSASSSQQTARNQSSELTRKASARSTKEHKVSFKVASAAGTEDQSVRLIKNPFPDRTTRVDYYQLVRKWRVDLYRYGVRLTYDLTIPEPGSDILTKIIELKAVMGALQEGFGSPTATLPWARFDLVPSQVQRWNYLALAAQYGATVEPPPDDEIVVAKGFTRNWPTKDSTNASEYTAFEIEVPEGYVVRAWSINRRWWGWPDEAGFHFEVRPDLNNWIGAGGTLNLSVGTMWINAFDIQLRLRMGLTATSLDAWRQRVWGALREAAQARYELNRTMLKDRLAQLQEELSAQDALSLRKIEREEVMKQVLRWLFGPTFTFVPPGLPPELYGPNGAVLDDATWGQVLAHGEVIKFLHQAIEWENMLFFLYPYFWSHTSRWQLKKYLDHPDFLHRVFLKAGSARVVLTIRPGFEHDFMSFLETGTLDGLPNGHPYLTIADEMRAFAMTNYPGIRAANPIENARPLLTPLQIKAWDEMQQIIGLLEQHKALHGAYPTTAQGLAALAPLGTVPAADPWGSPYDYKSPGRVQDFELRSLGADGEAGGTGEDADIASWSEASLIGQWFEYTPTSALDIAFDDTLPSA